MLKALLKITNALQAGYGKLHAISRRLEAFSGNGLYYGREER